MPNRFKLIPFVNFHNIISITYKVNCHTTYLNSVKYAYFRDVISGRLYQIQFSIEYSFSGLFFHQFGCTDSRGWQTANKRENK